MRLVTRSLSGLHPRRHATGQQPDVELTGHWCSSNSSGWADDLVSWSKRYLSSGEVFKK